MVKALGNRHLGVTGGHGQVTIVCGADGRLRNGLDRCFFGVNRYSSGWVEVPGWFPRIDIMQYRLDYLRSEERGGLRVGNGDGTAHSGERLEFSEMG